jgi:hypothetical protein
MKKKEKGEFGYLKYKKFTSLLIMLLSYALIGAAFLCGFLVTKTTANIMTVVAVILALPAAKFTVAYVIVLPHHSVTEELYRETHGKFSGLITCYDCIFSNKSSPIGAQVVVISDTLVIALTDEKNADKKLFEESTAQFCENDGHPLKAVLYTDKDSFIAKANVLCGSYNADSKPTARMERNADSVLRMCI